MRMFKVALPAILLSAGFVLCTTASYGKPEYAKKEKKACTSAMARWKPKRRCRRT
jgi:hypothetical protein